jgi:hypothetical protein
LNPRPKAYESSALPLSYSGMAKSEKTVTEAFAEMQVRKTFPRFSAVTIFLRFGRGRLQ